MKLAIIICNLWLVFGIISVFGFGLAEDYWWVCFPLLGVTGVFLWKVTQDSEGDWVRREIQELVEEALARSRQDLLDLLEQDRRGKNMDFFREKLGWRRAV